MRHIDWVVDPEVVRQSALGTAAFLARIGTPKRCETNHVHPGLGCCLFCGSESGEACKDRGEK